MKIIQLPWHGSGNPLGSFGTARFHSVYDDFIRTSFDADLFSPNVQCDEIG